MKDAFFMVWFGLKVDDWVAKSLIGAEKERKVTNARIFFKKNR